MGELLGILIWGLFAGVIIGPLARLVLPGKQNISLTMTIVVGAVGAIFGGLIADWLGVGDTAGNRLDQTCGSSRCCRCCGGRLRIDDRQVHHRLNSLLGIK